MPRIYYGPQHPAIKIYIKYHLRYNFCFANFKLATRIFVHQLDLIH